MFSWIKTLKKGVTQFVQFVIAVAVGLLAAMPATSILASLGMAIDSGLVAVSISGVLVAIIEMIRNAAKHHPAIKGNGQPHITNAR